MIKIENTEVVGWEHAIRGARNPMNSWEKTDSGYCLTHEPGHCADCVYTEDCHGNEVNIGTKYIIGPNDHDLMTRLRNAGTDHRKFMRMIVVYLDITAPLYWWKEFKTYRAGRKFGDPEPDIIDPELLEMNIETNSCSTMHKIAEKEFKLEDFSTEHLIGSPIPNFNKHVYVTEKEEAGNKCYSFGLGATPICFMEWVIGVLNTYRELYLETKEKVYWWQMIQLLPSSYNQKRTVMLNYEVLANIYKSRKNHKLDEWREFCDWIETLPYSELITGKE